MIIAAFGRRRICCKTLNLPQSASEPIRSQNISERLEPILIGGGSSRSNETKTTFVASAMANLPAGSASEGRLRFIAAA